MNEEVANKTVNLAVTGAKVTARALLRALAKANQELKQQKAVVKQKRNARKQMKANEPKHGKQTIKQLIGQGQGVSSMDVGDTGMRDFKRIANKYGVDFAIVKDNHKSLSYKYCLFYDLNNNNFNIFKNNINFVL